MTQPTGADEVLLRFGTATGDQTELPCGPQPVCSMWITSETGTIHYGCSPDRRTARELLDRYLAAGIAIKTEIGPCCHDTGDACSFDVFADQVDEMVVLSYALARAEGRQIAPPYRCSCCGHMTYGGCCG